MIVICGLTCVDDGRIEASSTQSPGTSQTMPHGLTTELNESVPMRAVPIGW